MKEIFVILAAAFCSGTMPSSKAESCAAIGYWKPDVLVFENEPFARIWLYRSENTNLVQTVDYFTQGGAGVHFVARSGTATLAVGQSVTSVDVPLIDNGLLDGFKAFRLVLRNPSLGLEVRSQLDIRIQDNEMGSALDPLFVPDIGAGQLYGSEYFAASMPDGRILVPGGSAGLAMLQPNGGMDIEFADTFGKQFLSGRFGFLQVLSDGRILAVERLGDTGSAPQRLIRLLPTGALDSVFTIPNFTGVAAAQPDGKIVVLSANAKIAPTLRRLNSDGSPDATFTQGTFDFPDLSFVRDLSFAFPADGKILVNGRFDRFNGVEHRGLVRLNSDGSLENAYAPAVEGYILDLFLRANGKVIVPYNSSGIQLDDDGSIDPGFKLEGSPYGFPWAALEQLDGWLVRGEMEINGFGAVTRLNRDGSLGPDLARIRGLDGMCSYSGLTLALTEAGQILLAGNITNVDGFPRPGLARLLANPPERDFRVLTPSEFCPASGAARVQVVRTGPTTNAAFISFTTRDDTAKAGEDYLAQRGTLNFAPLEVSKEIPVPLLGRAGIDARLFFKLELSNPSSGYMNIASTPIAIVPDLRIVTDSLRPRGDSSITITLHGTLLRRWYCLETSTDLENWQCIAGTEATASMAVFDSFRPNTSPHFFRVRSN